MTKEINERESLLRLRWQLALPGPMVVLVTLLFWSLGGGAESPPEPESKAGLNVQVPAPAKEGKAVDKLALYKMAQMDSARTAETGKMSGMMLARRDSLGWKGDSNERRVEMQLADLKARLRGATGSQIGLAPVAMRGGGVAGRGSEGTFDGRMRVGEMREEVSSSAGWQRSRSADIDRLERLVTTMKESGSGGSPPMQELNRTLDKLIAVQHPGKAAVDGLDSGVVALTVSPVGKGEAVSGMKGMEAGGNRFYDLESSSGEDEPTGTAIEAIVPETQTVVNGATMRLELATELVIRGRMVPKGASLYGTVRISNERLQVHVNSIRSGNELYPVALRVLDQDGLAGLYSPGSMSRDAVRESASEAVGTINGAGIDGTASGQAMNAGIQLARNLARRKVQLVRVTVKAGYRVFLQDESKGR